MDNARVSAERKRSKPTALAQQTADREDTMTGNEMNRKGKPLTVLPTGHPRRMADGKNAWRKMNPTQREEFVLWLAGEGLAETLADVSDESLIADLTCAFRL